MRSTIAFILFGIVFALPAAHRDGAQAQVRTAARTVYVSSSTGREANTGLTADSPKRSIEQGYALLRDGHGDRLLLKRGDRFAETVIWTKSGASRSRPAKLGSYGDGPRPIIEGGASDSLILSPGYRATTPLRHVAVTGIHFYAPTRDPKSPHFKSAKPKHHAIMVTGHEVKAKHLAEDIRIEDVRIEAFGSGIGIVGGGASGGTRDVRIRRTQILDSYSVQGHMHGLFASETHGLLLEDSIIDNTQRAEVPGVVSKPLDHSIYIQSNSTDVTIRGNVLSRGPDGCMQRPGGVFEDNLVIDVELGSNQGLIWGGTKPVGGGIATVVRRNAFVGIDRGAGLMLGNIRSGEIRDNIFLGDRGGKAIELYGTTRLDNIGVHDLLIQDNIALGVRGLVFHDRRFSKIIVQDNAFRGSKPLVSHAFFHAKTFRYANNRYAGPPGPGAFVVGEHPLHPKAWAAKAGEPLRFEQLTAAPEAPGIAQYMQEVVGNGGGLEAFLEGARDPARKRWHDAYSARNVIRYLREKLTY